MERIYLQVQTQKTFILALSVNTGKACLEPTA
jgi:hypothetical protein